MITRVHGKITMVRNGKGGALIAVDVPTGVVLQFTKRIERNDVCDGKLVPVSINYTRKSKRVTEISLNVRGEEALFELLRDRREERLQQERALLAAEFLHTMMHQQKRGFGLFDFFRRLRFA